jgi:hypothetical protein
MKIKKFLDGIDTAHVTKFQVHLSGWKIFMIYKCGKS